MFAGAEDLQPKDLAVGIEVEVEHALVGVERGDLLGRSGWDGVLQVEVRRVGVAVVGADQGDGSLHVHGDQVATPSELAAGRRDGSGLRTLNRAIGLVVVQATSVSSSSPW